VASSHRLKGASANVSADGLRKVAAELESLGRAGQLTDVGTLLDQLDQQYALLQADESSLLAGS